MLKKDTITHNNKKYIDLKMMKDNNTYIVWAHKWSIDENGIGLGVYKIFPKYFFELSSAERFYDQTLAAWIKRSPPSFLVTSVAGSGEKVS